MSSDARPTMAPAPPEAHAAQAGLASASPREDALKTIVDSLMQQAILPKAPHLSVDEALGIIGPGIFTAESGYRIVKRGVPSRLLEPLGRYLGLGKGEVAEYLAMDRTTAFRKAIRDEALPMHAAESMLRLLELRRLSESTFATSVEADEWLRRPHPMLEDESPLECAKSAFGAQRVKDMLVALRYGGVV